MDAPCQHANSCARDSMLHPSPVLDDATSRLIFSHCPVGRLVIQVATADVMLFLPVISSHSNEVFRLESCGQIAPYMRAA